MLDTRPPLTRVLETVLYYADASASERFYSDALGMRLLSREPGRSLFYLAGESVFLLFDAEETLKGTNLPAHGTTGPAHTCFQVAEADYELWEKYLISRGVPIIQETHWPTGISFYFHDPHGNVLKIANADIWPK